MRTIRKTDTIRDTVAAAACSRMQRAFVMLDRRITGRALAILYIVAVAISYVTLVVPGRAYTAVWLNDTMGLLDAANRVHLGEEPYRDFHFLYGPLVALIPGLGLDLGFSAGAAFAFDAVVAAALVLLVAVVAMPRRLSLPAAVMVFLFVWLLIVVPMGEGRTFRFVSWGTFYNRHGWAALIVALLFYLEPERARRYDKWSDAVALAVLVLFEIYTKFTFGLVALGFVAANLCVSPYNRRMSLICLLFVGLVAAALEAAWHFHAIYYRDIVMFVSLVPGGDVSTWGVVEMVVKNAPIILAGLGAWLALSAAGRRNPFDGLFVIGCIATGMMLRATVGDNDTGGRLVSVVALFVCLGELARRAEIDWAMTTGTRSAWRHHVTSLGCLLLFLVFVANESANRLLAWEDYAEKGVRAAFQPLPGTPPRLASFIVPKARGPSLVDWQAETRSASDELTQIRLANIHPRELTAADYMRTIIEGAALLRTTDIANRSVLVFDEVNPFTYALDMRPIEHGYPQFWLGNGITAKPALLPRSRDFFADADLVMVPKLPYDPNQLMIMERIYGPYLAKHYAVLKQSAHWTLWARDGGS